MNLCRVCDTEEADESLKSDIPSCRQCFNLNASTLKELKSLRYKKGYLFPEYNEVLKGKLYIGNEDSGSILSIMSQLNITHILVAGSHLLSHFPDKFTYLTLNIDDSLSQNISEHFQSTFDFIEQPNAVVYVHCAAGVSRSASITIAYLMKKLNLSFEQAHNQLKLARPIIHPNEYFVEQLQQYEKYLQSLAITQN